MTKIYRPTITPSSTVIFKSGESLEFLVSAKTNCPNGFIKDIQAATIDGKPLKVLTMSDKPNELQGNVILPPDEKFVNGSLICVKATDNNGLKSPQSCFNILIEAAFTRNLMQRERRNADAGKDTSITISQSMPLCSYSSFAIIFVYYWCMFIGMHLLTLTFLISYKLKQYYTELKMKSLLENAKRNLFNNYNNKEMTNASSNSKPNNYESDNYGFDNNHDHTGFPSRNDTYNQAILHNNSPNKTSSLFPMSKQGFF